MKNLLFVLFCIVSIEQSFAQCGSLTVTAAVTSNYNGSQISCFGSNDGQITATATGGQVPYTYQLVDNGLTNTTGVFTGLGSGAYSVKVIDANNCEEVSLVLNIVQPTLLVATGLATSNYNGQHLSCAGSNDGMITVIASGGAGLYSYGLNQIPFNTTGTFTGVFTGLAAGTYTFNVTDQNGCQSTTAPNILTSPTPVTATTSGTSGEPDDCTDGGLTVNASGGTGAFFYRLTENPVNTTGAVTGGFTGLTTGIYTVMVRDENNCVYVTSPITITQGSPISASATITSNFNGHGIQCFGNSNGQVTVTATGGTGSLFYTLNEASENTTGSSSGIFSNLSAGTYSITVADQAQCETVTIPVVLSAPPVMTTEAAITSNYNGAHISCVDANDGEVTFTATGGTQPYQYSLNGTTNVTGIFTALSANTYSSATVTDVNGCIAVSGSVTLVSPTALNVIGEVTPDQTGDDGRVLLTVTGGTTPYDFLWSNGSLLQNLSNVSGGEYSVDVTDANECFISRQFEIPVIVSVDSSEPKNSVELIFDKTQNVFALHCDLVKQSRVSVDVIDGQGKPIRNITTQHEGNQHQFLLSKEPLSSGFYIARIKIDKEIFVKKFFVF